MSQGTVGDRVYAIGQNGNPLWAQATPGAARTPIIAVASPFITANLTLYVPSLNFMLAIDPVTHAVAWTVTHPDPTAHCNTAVFSDFNYYFTAVYFTCGNTLYAVNAERGRVDWTFNVTNEGSLTAPAISATEGTVFVGSSKVGSSTAALLL